MGSFPALAVVAFAMAAAAGAVFLVSLIFLRLLAAVMFSFGVICAGAIGCFLGLLAQIPFSGAQDAGALAMFGIIAGCGCLVALVAGCFIWRALPDVDKKFSAESAD
jgi:hypothetical protein